MGDRRLHATPEGFPDGRCEFRADRRAASLSVNGFDDIGFLDDRSLAPKPARDAVRVAAASCRHHNADILSEVYATGRWNPKSMLHLHGPPVVLSFFPLFISLRAADWRFRSWTMFVYHLVWGVGVLAGAWRFQFGQEKHRAK